VKSNVEKVAKSAVIRDVSFHFLSSPCRISFCSLLRYLDAAAAGCFYQISVGKVFRRSFFFWRVVDWKVQDFDSCIVSSILRDAYLNLYISHFPFSNLRNLLYDSNLITPSHLLKFKLHLLIHQFSTALRLRRILERYKTGR